LNLNLNLLNYGDKAEINKILIGTFITFSHIIYGTSRVARR